MSKTLTVSYDLKPPAGTIVPASHQPSKLHTFSITAGNSQQEFYKALRDAVVLAKTQIGEDLTVWRDAVGTKENAKEPIKGQTGDDEEDEEEGEA